MKAKLLDFVIFFLFFFCSVFFIVILFGQQGYKAKYIQIDVDGATYIYPIAENFSHNFKSKKGFIKVHCDNGLVYVAKSSCKDKICQRKRIDKTGQSIVCLPNFAFITIVGDNDEWLQTDGVDDVSF